MEIDNIIPEFDEIDVFPLEEAETEQQNQEDQNTEVTEETDESAYALFKTLKEKNIIPYNEGEEIKSWEKLEERLGEIPTIITQSIIDEAPEHTKQLFKYAFTKGQELTKEDLKTFINTYLDDVSDKTIETNDQAREVLKKVYSEQGMRDKAINAALDVLEDDEELIEEAKKYSKQNNSDKLIDNAVKEKQDKLKADEQFVKDIQTNLKELNWKPERMNIINKELSSNTLNNKITEVAKDPKNLIQLANFLSYYDSKSKQFDFKSFVEQTFSKEANNLKNSILKDNFNSASTTKIATSNPIKIDLDKLTPILDLD